MSELHVMFRPVAYDEEANPSPCHAEFILYTPQRGRPVRFPCFANDMRRDFWGCLAECIKYMAVRCKEQS